jgi:hypothetical protein
MSHSIACAMQHRWIWGHTWPEQLLLFALVLWDQIPGPQWYELVPGLVPANMHFLYRLIRFQDHLCCYQKCDMNTFSCHYRGIDLRCRLRLVPTCDVSGFPCKIALHVKDHMKWDPCRSHGDLLSIFSEFKCYCIVFHLFKHCLVPIIGCDKSLDLLGSDPIIEREQRAKQQYFTYWLLGTCKDKTRLVTKCF